MANKCINQLILSGDRKSILDLIMSDNLYYKKHEIHEINNGTFCAIIFSEWTPPERHFTTISKEYPTINFDIFYAVKLSNIRGHVNISDGNISRLTGPIALTMSEMSNQLSSKNFYIPGELIACNK